MALTGTDVVVGVLLAAVGAPAISCVASAFRQPSDAPRAVQKASVYEIVFSLLLTFVSVGMYVAEYPAAGKVNPYLATLLIGLGWIWFAAALRRGRAWTRRVCLILSVVRLPTVIGIPFSVLSLHALYRTDAANEYYATPSTVDD